MEALQQALQTERVKSPSAQQKFIFSDYEIYLYLNLLSSWIRFLSFILSARQVTMFKCVARGAQESMVIASKLLD